MMAVQRLFLGSVVFLVFMAGGFAAGAGEREKVNALVNIGEMVPYYIMRYGFYEGHTDYRADPVAVAWIFGLKSLEQIEAVFPGRLEDVLTQHFTR
jgi:hypothetical protein